MNLRRRCCTPSVIAFDLEATLVSDDRAFHDDPIPDLKVENWLIG